MTTTAIITPIDTVQELIQKWLNSFHRRNIENILFNEPLYDDNYDFLELDGLRLFALQSNMIHIFNGMAGFSYSDDLPCPAGPR